MEGGWKTGKTEKGGEKEMVGCSLALSLMLSPDSRVDCIKLDFNYSRKITLDPKTRSQLREEEEEEWKLRSQLRQQKEKWEGKWRRRRRGERRWKKIDTGRGRRENEALQGIRSMEAKRERMREEAKGDNKKQEGGRRREEGDWQIRRQGAGKRMQTFNIYNHVQLNWCVNSPL